MATQVVLNGSAVSVVHAAPHVNTENFFWTTTDDKILSPNKVDNVIPAAQPAAAKPAPTPKLPASAGVLTLLEGKTFAGTGFNNIFRPRSNVPLKPAVPGGNDNVLQLNLTKENLAFSQTIGNVPNRGFAAQPDIILHGISYVQTVSDITNPKTGSNDGAAQGIHFEPGMWIAIPACAKSPIQGPTLCRMASIPHGTTINAQGAAPDLGHSITGKPTIEAVDITPFSTGFPQQRISFGSQTVNTASSTITDRIPGDLSLFNQKGTITQAILSDPNTVLRNAIKGQDIASHFRIDINTLDTPVVGGGTANIAFLGGTGASVLSGGSGANAHATQMSATFWIETVKTNITAAPGQRAAQQIQVKGPGGIPGPTFVVAPTINHSSPVNLTVSWTQVQYSQLVLLNFNGLSWPHVSVATLAEQGEIGVNLPA